jgi:hypothetical protein
MYKQNWSDRKLFGQNIQIAFFWSGQMIETLRFFCLYKGNTIGKYYSCLANNYGGIAKSGKYISSSINNYSNRVQVIYLNT